MSSVVDRLVTDLVAGELDGVAIVPSRALPMPPSLPEWCRRVVRHQWGPEVLGWLGETVGPDPDAVTHVIYATAEALDAPTMFVSPEVHDELVDLLGVLGR